MNMRLRLSHADLLDLGGVSYRPVDIQQDFIVLEQADKPGITQRFTHEEVFALLSAPDTRYVPGYFTAAKSRLRKNCPVDLLAELDEATQVTLLWQKAVCDAFLALEHQGKVKRTYQSVQSIRAELELADSSFKCND